jgi:hypothetical protein
MSVLARVSTDVDDGCGCGASTRPTVCDAGADGRARAMTCLAWGQFHFIFYFFSTGISDTVPP